MKRNGTVRETNGRLGGADRILPQDIRVNGRKQGGNVSGAGEWESGYGMQWYPCCWRQWYWSPWERLDSLFCRYLEKKSVQPGGQQFSGIGPFGNNGGTGG